MRYLEDQKTCIQQLQQEVITDNMSFRMFAKIWELPRNADELDPSCCMKLKMLWSQAANNYSRYLQRHGKD